MRVIILSNVVEKLKSKKQAILFGFQEQETVIISSLRKRKGLIKVGIFNQKEENIIKDWQKYLILVSISGDKLKCLIFNSKRKTEEVEFEVVNYTTDFNKRNRGIIDDSILQEKTVRQI